MLRKATAYAIAVLLLGGLYLWALKAAQPHGPAEGQIQGAILAATAALNQGHASEAAGIVSPRYKDSTGLNRDQLRILARRAASSHEDWAAAVRRIDPRVFGDEASVDVVIQVRQTGAVEARDYPLTLTMRYEEAYAWGIFPTHRWRVVSASGIPGEAF